MWAASAVSAIARRPTGGTDGRLFSSSSAGMAPFESDNDSYRPSTPIDRHPARVDKSRRGVAPRLDDKLSNCPSGCRARAESGSRAVWLFGVPSVVGLLRFQWLGSARTENLSWFPRKSQLRRKICEDLKWSCFFRRKTRFLDCR